MLNRADTRKLRGQEGGVVRIGALKVARVGKKGDGGAAWVWERGLGPGGGWNKDEKCVREQGYVMDEMHYDRRYGWSNGFFWSLIRLAI